MSDEDGKKEKKPPPRPMLKKPQGESGDLRAAALSAYSKIQNPWGMTNLSSSLNTLEPHEIEAYALDFGLRTLWEIIRDGDDTRQCCVSDDDLLKLRELILATIAECVPGLTKESEFTIPDPVLVDKRDAEKREQAIAEMKAKQERQQQLEEERRARELKMSQQAAESNNQPPEEPKRGRHRKRVVDVEPITDKIPNQSEPNAVDTVSSSTGKEADGKHKEKKIKETKSSTSEDKKKKKKKRSKKTNESGEDGESKRKKRKEKKKDKEKKSTSEKENPAPEPDSETKDEPKEESKPNPRNRRRTIQSNASRMPGRPVLQRGGKVAEEEAPLPTITFKKSLVNISKLNEILKEKVKDAFTGLTSQESNGFLDYYHLSVKGPRPSNEDEYAVVENANVLLGLPPDADKYAFLAVYDGHSGRYASIYSRSQLHYDVFKHNDLSQDLDKAIHESFLAVDQTVNHVQSRENFNCGTTALSVWVRNEEELIIGNVGDCRGFLCRGGNPLEIANPHNPSREDEKERIKDCGGAVVWFGTWRVNGILAVSRSIGDYNLRAMVIPNPEITRYKIQPEDEFLLLASDGLWDGMQADEAFEIVKKTVADKGRQFVCQTLCDLAIERNTKDNVTVVVLFFDHHRK